MDILLAILFGVAGGFLGGLVGVGGGILFVPALAIFLDEPQVRAEATSLLAIVIVAIAGTWRQREYGNVRLGEAGVIGVLSIAGVAVGVVVANEVSERALEVGFAILALIVAAQLVFSRTG
jgi:uncharacterized protein